MMNAAKKTVRYSLIFLLVLFTLLVAAPFFIDANQYKSLIVDQAEKATGRHITIGKLHASLFPWVGLRIDDVHIANPKGFAAGDMLQVKSLDVQVAVMPLLGGKYQIERFVLDTPRLQLTRSAAGFTNWEDLLPAASVQATGQGTKSADTSQVPAVKQSAAEKKPQAGGMLAALSARALHMNDGEVHFTDATNGQDIHLNELNVEVENVQMQQPVGLQVSGKLDGNAFSLDGKLGPVGDLATLDPMHLPLKGHLSVPEADLGKLATLVPDLQSLGEGTLGLDVQLEQRPNGVRVMAGALKLHAAHDLALDVKAQMPDARRMQVEQLLASLDGIQVADVNGTLTGIGGAMHYQLRVNTPELTRLQLSQWVPDLQSMYAAHPAPWKTVKLGMLAAGDMKQVDIRDLQLSLDGDLVQATGNIGFARAPDIRLRIVSHLLHVDPWLPKPAEQSQAATANPPQPASPVASSGLSIVPEAHADTAQAGARIGGASVAEAGKAAVEPDLRFLKPWRIAAVVQVDRMVLRGLNFDRLRADVNGRKGVISMDPLRFDLASGHVEEKASLNAGVYPASWTESVKVRDVQLQPVLKALADNDMLSGSLQMDTQLGGRGLLPEAAMARLNGSGSVLLRDGSIKGFDIAAMLRNIKNFGQGSGEQKKTDFSQLSGSFKITNGVAKNDDLFVASPLFRLTGYGMVNLPAKQMDYHLKPRLVGSLVGQGDSEAVRKGLEVPLRLIGPLDKPQVRLEVSIESLLGNREAIQEIIKNPKGILRGLLGGQPAQDQGAQQPSQPARIEPKSQTKQPAQPAKPLERLLNQVLPGL